MNQADRIAELEEQIRQMREAFAPALTLPVSWPLSQRERLVLQGLLAREVFGPEQYRNYCDSRCDDDARNLTVRICRVRKTLRRCLPGVQIKTRWGVGYYIEPQDKRKIREAINAHNRHDLRAVA